MIGIILSSKFIDGTLKAQFGEILPIELPVQNKYLLNHQVDSLSLICDSIFFTVPREYKFEALNDFPKIELDVGLTLIEVLKIISDSFSIEERVFIYYGDTLLLNISNLNANEINFFVQRPTQQYAWGVSCKNGLVPAGGIIMSISDLKYFLNGCNDFDDLTNKLLVSKQVNLFSDFEWLDFGHTLTFYNSRKRFLETRSFNKIKHEAGYIIKSSNDILKIWSEFNWLKTLKEKLPLNVPYVTGFNIIKGEACYSIEYVNFPSLSDVFVFGSTSKNLFINILESIKSIIATFKSMSFGNIDYIDNNFLVQKLKDRNTEIIKIATSFDADVCFIEDCIKENIHYFLEKKSRIVPMHGDLCFSNILFDFATFRPIFIDPRGYTSNNLGFSMYGPENYDLYKLAHSYVMGYDFLIAGINDSFFFSKEEIDKRLSLFCQTFDIEKRELQMGLMNLFLTMLPLHSDSKNRQVLFLNILNKIRDL
jgi:hypothetical protein